MKAFILEYFRKFQYRIKHEPYSHSKFDEKLVKLLLDTLTHPKSPLIQHLTPEELDNEPYTNRFTSKKHAQSAQRIPEFDTNCIRYDSSKVAAVSKTTLGVWMQKSIGGGSEDETRTNGTAIKKSTDMDSRNSKIGQYLDFSRAFPKTELHGCNPL